MFLFKSKYLVSSWLLSCGLWMAFMPAASYGASEIKPIMKDMKRAYRQAMKSSDLTGFQTAFKVLKQKTQDSGKIPYQADPNLQSTYKEGLDQLQQQYQEIDKAINANDLAKAKQLLEKVRETEKRYHQKLDI